ncbi:apolipoprotein A-II [Pelodiscus sinensis]|uniref:Apolipoprotein A-II n=1 Tax=Pelodiscus sinensis TaxID=13735 RepID=K7FB84_PELSI|nr:apolipoprotein A-II [Pelodiscus sinensis]|eukprot:XP_006115258.1 apolipoprotein A-II [Pelodiscus sinensis]
MKVLVLAVVLLCAYHLEGAVVKREAQEASPTLTEVLSQYYQTVTEYMRKQLPEKEKMEEIKNQAKTYLDQANEQLAPIAKRMHTEFMELINQLIETGKKAAKQ